jgi:hypothetical protein
LSAASIRRINGTAKWVIFDRPNDRYVEGPAPLGAQPASMPMPAPPIVRQPKRCARPRDITPSLLVGSLLNLFYSEAAVSGEALDLF